MAIEREPDIADTLPCVKQLGDTITRQELVARSMTLTSHIATTYIHTHND